MYSAVESATAVHKDQNTVKSKFLFVPAHYLVEVRLNAQQIHERFKCIESLIEVVISLKY